MLRVIENTPRIITVMTKNDSSGKTGERRGSAVVPSEVRMEGGHDEHGVIKIMNIIITNIDPPGGGGGGDEPLAMHSRRQR